MTDKKHPNELYFPRPMSHPPDLMVGAPGLLRALASDVEQPTSGYVFGDVTADELRKIAAYLENPNSPRIPGTCPVDRFDAAGTALSLAETIERTPAAEGDALAFVSAGTSSQHTTIKVTPRVAALIMQLLEAVRAEQSSASTPHVA